LTQDSRKKGNDKRGKEAGTWVAILAEKIPFKDGKLGSIKKHKNEGMSGKGGGSHRTQHFTREGNVIMGIRKEGPPGDGLRGK